MKPPAAATEMPKEGDVSAARRAPSFGKFAAIFLIVACVVGGLAWFARARKAETSGAGPRGSASADRIVPVSTAIAQRRDVPVVLEGLGTVTPIAMVTVKTQVDGRLDRVLFKEGDPVKKGDVLAQVDARPFVIQLRQAEAALAKDQAQLKNAQLTLNRNKALLAETIVAQQTVDDSTAQLAQLEAQLLSDRALMDAARLNIDYARITSPIDGVTGVRLIDQGNVVRASDQTGLVVVTQLDPIAVIFTLPQDDLTEVATQLSRGPLKVELTSRDGSQLLGEGDLVLIDNQVNAQTSTIRLKATVPNAKKMLWPNAFVKARLRVATRSNALVVPTVAIQRGPQGTFVYVVDKDRTAQMKPVTVEQSENDVTIVVQGIEPGDIVVSDGQSQLRPGSKVSIRDGAQSDAGAQRPHPRGANSHGSPKSAPSSGKATARAGDAP